VKGALVLPGGGAYPTAWPIEGPAWGVQEWGFHVCLDDGTPNPQLTIDGVRGKLLDDMRGHGYKVRVTRDTSWPGSKADPAQFAAQLSGDVTYLNQNSKQCALGIDYEGKDGDWILAALQTIRTLRSGRGVFWTPQPNQGGWIKNYPALVSFINNDPLVFVVAQTYSGNMSPYGQADGIRVNLWDAGLHRDKVELYYGLNDKPDKTRWSGALYDWNQFVA
jgi:hypothetical protein